MRVCQNSRRLGVHDSKALSVRSEAIPAFWTSWRLPPACRQPRTCPAACRGRPGSSGWWSPWGCRNKEDGVIRTVSRGPHPGHYSGGLQTHLSTLQALYQPPYSPNGEPSFCFPWKTKASSDHQETESQAEAEAIRLNPAKQRALKTFTGRMISLCSPCSAPLSPQHASIWVCSHLQRKASKTGSGSEKRAAGESGSAEVASTGRAWGGQVAFGLTWTRVNGRNFQGT